jgi:hypothetical protein
MKGKIQKKFQLEPNIGVQATASGRAPDARRYAKEPNKGSKFIHPVKDRKMRDQFWGKKGIE